ncbi:cephalotocin receptor 1-like [Babylonia areolata]|uniref:cephalotocin receptor 1-like n=1 Tax=Babylonia areolata TaxID=304850 RepID=UPI003FD273FB
MEARATYSEPTLESLPPTTTIISSQNESFQRFSDNVSFPNASSNFSINQTDQGNYFDRDELLAKVEIGVLSLILHLALFGNIFVLVVLRLRRQTLTRMQWFIVHLSLADLFVALFNILPQLLMDITNQFHGGDFLCRSVKYLSVVAMYASSYVLLMAAVDRYVSICHPLTNQTLSPKRVHLMILLAWGLSFLFSLPQVFIFRLKEMDGKDYECYAEFSPGWGLKAYVTWIFLSVFALPFLLLTFCYTRICLVVWGSVDSKQTGTLGTSRTERRADSRGFPWRISFSKPSNSRNNTTTCTGRSAATKCGGGGASDVNGHVAQGGEGDDEHAQQQQSLRCLVSVKGSKPRGHQRGMSKSKVKTVKLTLTVVLCYLLCWTPFFLINLLTAWDRSIQFEGPTMTIIALLASLNSCTNPWIYLAFSGCSWLCCAQPAHRGSGGGISRSWTRSTHVITDSEAPLRNNRASLYELSQRAGSREVSPWTRGPHHDPAGAVVSNNHTA